MSIKKIVSLIILIISSCAITAASNPLPLLDYPTEEELKKVQELLDSLSPEELEELSKIGEEIIKAAEQEGRPLFGPSPDEQNKPVQPIAKQEPKPAPAKPKEEPKESSIPKKQLSMLQKMLSDLVDNVSSIRQKASAEEKLSLLLEPINKTLNSLSYYIRTIAYSQHAARLADKEFAQLKATLQTLSNSIDDLNNQLDVDDIDSLPTKKSNKQFKIQQAQSVLKKFIDVISSQSTQQLVTDLEAFMKKYEPEALELRKKQETQEKDASTFAKKLPVTNTGTVNPQLPTAPQDQTNKPSSTANTTGVKFGAPVQTPSGPSGLSVKPAGPMGSQGGGQQSGGSGGQQAQKSAPAKKPDDKKDDKKDDKREEIKDKQLSIDEQAQEIRNRIAALDRRVTASKQPLDSFFAYLNADPNEATPVEQRTYAQPIGELTYEAVKIKKSIDKWSETIGKTSEWAEARAYKDAMQQIVDRGLTEFRKLVAQVDTIANAPAATKTRRILSHDEDLKDLQKISKDLSTVKIKPK